MTQLLPVDVRDHARFEAVSTVYSRLLGTSIVNVLNASLLVFVIADQGETEGAYQWLALIALLSLGRVILYARHRADPDKEAHTRRWAAWAVAGSFGSGLLWGLGPVLPFGDFASQLWFWTFVIGGMTAGATSLHTAHLPTALAFTIPASLPLAVALLMQDTLQGYAAAVMTLAFITTMTFTGLLFSREFARTQELKFSIEARAVELNETNMRLSREIADHRTTSEALHQSQKMEALGKLTSGLAHDFNNILTVIINDLDMIATGSRQVRMRELALSAMGAAESGADLLSRLLAFARKRTLEPRSVNLIDVVCDFRELLLHAVSGSIRVEFDFVAPVAVASIDVPQFQAMLLNLVVNARDAMPQGGQITITVSAATLGADALEGTEAAPGDFVAVAVADDGTGMSRETLAHAFEPFYTTKADRGGTGLGLAQVYGFARQSGGFGRIESELGRGTCVTIFLPAGEACAEAEIVALRPKMPPRPYSVLIVDDNLSVLRAIAGGLAEEGWDAVSLSEPGAVLEAVAGRAFDIVVTDVDMPGDMNGLELATALAARHPGLPVLLMSGAAIGQDAPEPSFPFITKPFRKQALIERMQALIGEGPAGEGAV